MLMRAVTDDREVKGLTFSVGHSEGLSSGLLEIWDKNTTW